MSESGLSFGRRAADCTSSAALIELEIREGRAERFAAIDTVLAGLAVRGTRGDRVVLIERGDRRDHVEIVGVPTELRVEMIEAFRLESQQSRGAWFLPEAVSINAGMVNFAGHLREHPRYAHTVASEECGKAGLAGSADAMVLWSALEPMFELLLAPIILRSHKSGTLTREEFAAEWSTIERVTNDLGLDLREALHIFQAGGGWARLSPEQQIAAKTTLLSSIAETMSIDVVRRYRAHAIRALVAHYYAKAKTGRAKRRQIVTKEHWRTLAAFFAGDWLAFVEYLGEQPHDEERIVTALPETKLMVGGREKAAEIAARKGIPIAEMERMLGAYWDGADGDSPVGQRAAVLSRYWREFDAVHTRQAPGMPPLWGLVQESGWGDLEPQPWTPYQPEFFRRLLSSAVVADIERLWGHTVLEKWPDRIVSEPFPHSAMAEALGPALRFWHGCALTAWFVCEGPRSRTDIPGLAHYYRRELADLEETGCGVPPQLFEELSGVRLGPEEPIYERSESLDVGHGVSVDFRMSSGSRRDGFARLRDVIARHRQWWTSNAFERYLRTRWESELKAVGKQFHLMTEESGKPPPLKRFAKHALSAARRWFGGDVALLYAALGQKLATKIEGSFLMPRESVRFASLVFEALGGEPLDRKIVVSSPEEGRTQARAQDRHHKLRRLSGESLRYVQLQEALGVPPTRKDFGHKFDSLSQILASSADEAWSIYERAVDLSLAQMGAPYTKG